MAHITDEEIGRLLTSVMAKVQEQEETRKREERWDAMYRRQQSAEEYWYPNRNREKAQQEDWNPSDYFATRIWKTDDISKYTLLAP
jgi:hypothetical protein